MFLVDMNTKKFKLVYFFCYILIPVTNCDINNGSTDRQQPVVSTNNQTFSRMLQTAIAGSCDQNLPFGTGYIKKHGEVCKKSGGRIRCVPDKCDATPEDCPYLISWELDEGEQQMRRSFKFEIVGQSLKDKAGKSCNIKQQNGNGYIALAFSAQPNATLLIVECSIGSGGSKVRLGWGWEKTYEFWDYECQPDTKTGKISECCVNVDENDNIFCTFHLLKRIILKMERFDFQELHYYLYGCSGCGADIEKDGFWNGANYFSPGILIDLNDLNETKYTEGIRSHFALSHGCLMIIVWFVLIPNGMLLARYFKESFVNFSIFKYRLWFAGHVTCMLLAAIFTITAVGTVMHVRAQVDFAWPTNANSQKHFTMGFMIVFLQALQVCFGWFRFEGKKTRRIFAFVHLLNGWTVYIFALVCIGSTYSLGMWPRVKYFTAGLLIWNLSCHLAMTIYFNRVDKNLGLYIYRAFYPFPIAPVTYDEVHGSKVRLTILLVHMFGTAIISAALLVDYVYR